jgi:hypothetical protein
VFESRVMFRLKKYMKYQAMGFSVKQRSNDNGVTVRSKAYICGPALAGIVGSNPTGGMGVCLLYSVCVVR